MSIFHNLWQIAVSAVGIAALTIPTGILALRALGMWRAHLLMLPAALIAGMLILPLLWNWLGAISLPAAVMLWGMLFFVRRPALPLDLTLTYRQRIILCTMSLCAVILTTLPLMIHDTPTDDGSYLRTQATDWAKHIAVVSAISLSAGLPPANPFLSIEPQLHYYYLPYLLPALMQRTFGLSAANSLIGAALLLAGAFPLLLIGYGRQVGLNGTRALWAAFLATFVAGFDILFVLITALTTGIWSSDVDFWVKIGDRTLTTILTHFIWVPQHTQGLLAIILALWTLHLMLRDDHTLRARLICAVGLALWLAALAGSSAFLWLTTCAALAGLVLWEAIRRRRRNALLVMGALLLSLAFSAPYLLLVAGRGRTPFMLAISGSGALAPFAALFGASPLSNLLDFPLQIVVELGVLLFTGVVGLWRLRRGTEFRVWTLCLLTTLVVLLAVRDQPHANNFAARVGTLAWLMLALGSAYSLDLFKRWWARLLLMLGIFTVVYTPFGLLREPYYVSADEHAVYQWLNTHLAPDEVYQMGSGMEGNQPYFVERLTGLSDDVYQVAALYASSDMRYRLVVGRLYTAFNTYDAFVAASVFSAAGVDFVVVSEPLPAQQDAQFSRYFQQVYANNTYSIYSLSP